MAEDGVAARARWVAGGRRIPIAIGDERFHIFVREDGDPDGAPILFFHGFPSSSWDWSHVAGALGAEHRLIFFDFLGFGASDKPVAHRYAIEEQAAIAEAVAHAFSLERFHLVAHDYGTTVALEWLSRTATSSRLRSLTLLNGGLFSALHRPVLVQKLLDSPAGALVARLLSKKRFERTMQRILSPQHPFDTAEIDAQWAALCENGGNRLGHRLIHYMRDRRERGAPWSAALLATDVPVAFVWGLLDPISGAHVLEFVRDRLAHQPFVATLEDVGHYPQIEAPERVAAALEGFIGAH